MLLLHRVAVQTAEATANYVNRVVVNQQMGIPSNQGKRYSWGYPACPDLDDHKLVWQLMPQIVTDIGVSLTESFQLVPEQSTAAIIVHHPDAKYYTVRGAAGEASAERGALSGASTR